MNSLVIDTSTQRLLLAVATSDGKRRLYQQASQGNHAGDILERIRPMVEGVKINRIGVVLGPGSFTGLRIGLSVAKGLAEGWGCSLFGLNNLRAMARTFDGLYPTLGSAVLCAIDARKKRYYGSLTFQGRELIPVSDWSAERWLTETRKVWAGPVAVSGFQGDLLAAEWSSLPDQWKVLPLQDWAIELLRELGDCQDGDQLSPSTGPQYGRLSEAEELRLAKDPNSTVRPDQAD